MADADVKTDDATGKDADAAAADVADKAGTGADAAKAGADTAAGKNGADKGADADAATLAEAGKGEGDKKAAEKDVQPTWPSDWREKLAGGDEKALGRLKRFNSPENVGKALMAADQRINSGDFIEKLPEKPTDEQVKAYREKLGIPEKPEGYLDKLSDGLNIGDEDKPIVEGFLKAAHEKNFPPEVVDAAMQWYYNEIDQRNAALAEHDKEFRTASDDELRSRWDQEYRPNLNLMNSFLDTAPEGVKDAILNGRGADGNLLGDNPKVLDWLVSLAKEQNPAGIVAPGEGSSAKGIDDRLAEIQKYRRENREKYYKDEKVLEEERRLLDAREKMKARA